MSTSCPIHHVFNREMFDLGNGWVTFECPLCREERLKEPDIQCGDFYD